MLINDVLYSQACDEYEIIHESCQQFIYESDGTPMVKLLSNEYDDFKKVKIRKRKNTASFADSFNEAFEHEMYQLRERSLFANGITFLNEKKYPDDVEPFYIFPIDGYDFIYSGEIKDSSKKYSTVFNEIFDELGGKSAERVFSDLIKFSYTSENLSEGLNTGAEIIIYGIPYYYAIRQSSVNQYNDIDKNIKT